jgi:hypothetical protein
VVRDTIQATSRIRAVPDTSAEEMNSGAISAVFQNGRATSSPKIHAVTEWTSTATGKVTMAMIRSARCMGGAG